VGYINGMPAVVITGLPALLIILVILALLITGVVTAVRASARGAKRLGRGPQKQL
jgi:hypothetical protein